MQGAPSRWGEVFKIFSALFSYARNPGVVLKVDDTLSLGETLLLRFAAVSDYAEHLAGYLEGPLGTLVIERMDPLEIH